MTEMKSNEWPQRAKPAGRNRRIATLFKSETADHLLLLARVDGKSVNHELETIVDGEYTRRMQDPAFATAAKALAKLNGGK